MTIADSNVFFSSTKSISNHPQTLLPQNESSESAEFNPIEKKYWLKKYALGTSPSSANSKATQTSITTISNSIIEDISFGCNVNENKIAVATGPRVCIKDIKSPDKIDKMISFLGPVYSVQFRDGDGRVMAIGGDNGLVRIVDLSTRATLRTFISGNLTIRVIKWLRDGKRLIVGSDDGRIYIWDLTKDIGMDVPKPTNILIGHGDSIRDCLVTKLNKDSDSDKYYIISGSYDHTIRIWDLDTGLCERVLYGHAAPVEALCVIPSKNKNNSAYHIASVSNVSLYVHDIASGQILRKTTNTYHAKTISSLMYYHDEQENISRLITGGIDGFIRIHHVYTLATLHGATISSPISTMTYSISKKLFLIGTSIGTLLFHASKSKPSSQLKRKTIEPMKGTYSYFFRTNNTPPTLKSSIDHIITQPQKKMHLIGTHKYDEYLRKFQYSDALDDAFFVQRNPNHVHALLQELSKRNGLMIALSNREKGTIVPIISYLTKYIDNPAFTNIFLNVGCIILDIYSEKYAGKKNKVQQLDNDDDDFEKSMSKLKHVIDCEMRAQKLLKEELSTYDCVFNFVGSMNLV